MTIYSAIVLGALNGQADDPSVGQPSTAPISLGQAHTEGDEFLEEMSQFETVVVQKKPISKDQTQDSTSIDGQVLRDSARENMFDALSQQSADIYVTSTGAIHGVANGATGSIHIRGLGGSPNSQILMVEDGAPDYQGIFGHPIPDAYVPTLIDKVLVIKGGDSVLYGTNALGAVIVIRNRWKESSGYEVNTDSGYGSFATLRESASFLGKFGGWDVAGAFFGLKTDGQRQGEAGDEAIGQVAARYSFSQKIQLSLRNKIFHLDGADPGTVSHPYFEHWYDVWRDTVSAQLLYSSEPVRLTVTGYLNVGDNKLYDGFHSRDYVGGGSAEADWKVHPMVNLLLGLAIESVGGMAINSVTGDYPNTPPGTDISFYNQLTLRPVKPLVLVLGSRELFSTTYGFIFVYKGGIRWEAFEGFDLHTNVAKNFRQPTFRELYLPYPVANPKLKPELAINWDFGANWKYGHLELSASGYMTNATNLIKYFGAWPTAEVINIGHVVIWGVEGTAAYRHLGPVSISVSGDWQTVGQYTAQNPSAKVNFSVECEKTFGVHYFDVNLAGEWDHGLYMADYYRRPLPDVFFMDLSARYRFSSPDKKFWLEPYLFLRNFLNRNYAFVEGYPMPGFNVFIGLKVGV